MLGMIGVWVFVSLLEFGFRLVARLKSKSKLKFKKGGTRIHWWWRWERSFIIHNLWFWCNTFTKYKMITIRRTLFIIICIRRRIREWWRSTSRITIQNLSLNILLNSVHILKKIIATHSRINIHLIYIQILSFITYTCA